MPISRLHPGHAPKMADLCKELHAESDHWRPLAFSKAICEQSVYAWARNKSIICYVYVNENQIVGFGKTTVDQHFFGPGKVAYDTFICVSPAHRNMGYGIRLLKKLLEELDKLDVESTTLEVTSGVELGTSAKIADKYGFIDVGTMYKRMKE